MKHLIACAALLLLASATINAERKTETGSAEVKVACEYTVSPAEEYQREVWVGMCAQDVSPKDLLKAMTREFGSLASLAVLHEGWIVPSMPDLQDPALRKASYAAGYKAALAKLGIDAKARKNVRVSVVALYEAGVHALQLAAENEIDADQFVLIEPPVGDLAQVSDKAPKTRGIDIFLHPRSKAEGEREEAELIDKLGTWGRNARIITSFARSKSLGELLAEVWKTLRGYEIFDVARYLKNEGKSARSGEQLASKLAEYDVVFLGELHGNPGAHAMQYDVIRALSEKWQVWALATEHFERDVQAAVDAYLASGMMNRFETPEEHEKAEKEFLKNSRPWPNHADYRPLVDLCRRQGRALIAGNVPRRLASRINKEGPEALAKFSEQEKAWCAKEIVANDGPYKDKFFQVMGSSTSAAKDEAYARLERMYAAQCLKDDTMAESVVNWLAANKGAKVVHINGAFHSAGGLGIPEKIKKLNPALKIAVVTCEERASDVLNKENLEGNDFMVLVPSSRPSRRLKGDPDENSGMPAHK